MKWKTKTHTHSLKKNLTYCVVSMIRQLLVLHQLKGLSKPMELLPIQCVCLSVCSTIRLSHLLETLFVR